MEQKPYRDPKLLGLVFAGGVLGTGMRELFSAGLGDFDGIPFGILVVNVIGAWALGALMAFFGTFGADGERERAVRLFFGTGVLGGFTTYSALAFDVALFSEHGRPVQALTYAVVSVILGVAAAWLGTFFGGWLGRVGVRIRAWEQSGAEASSHAVDEIEALFEEER